MKFQDVIYLFERLTGRKACDISENNKNIDVFENGIGYSQLNEILILLGYERVSIYFFRFLSNCWDEKINPSINSLNELEAGIDSFSEIALLFFGNIRFAFEELSSNDDLLQRKIIDSLPIDEKIFHERHAPILKIEEIPKEKTFFLGYIIEGELKDKLNNDPNNKELLELEEERKKYVEIGKNNQEAYLASDHLDVYVATSMREAHEFIFANNVINDVFNAKELKKLKLRYFDPTQAYCNNRVDKGLSEALMLKNAGCTLYLAQETDTLGKDSELASTLAQGKAVIVYVPIGDKRYVNNLLTNLFKSNKDKTEKEVICNYSGVNTRSPDLIAPTKLIKI